MTPECKDCAHVKWDRGSGHLRCHSPQLARLKLAGIIVQFERGEIEPGRTNAKTQQCGPDGRNFVKRDAAA